MTQAPSILWYQYLAVLREDAPELIDEYIENTATKMGLSIEYFTAEFL